MRSIRTILAGAAVAALAVTAAPFTAQAAGTAPVDAKAPAGIQADGRLHAYFGTWYNNECGSWSTNASSWGECHNTAASLWNMRYPGNLDDVWVYYNSGYGGAGRGVYNGAGLPDLKEWNFGPGGAGAGEWLYHNIASHKFVNLP
ncbi:hypothetical protein ACWGHM_15550 [Streptomyces sp. NPDC054904]|uniref:hypothetical protein n=1 Tax=unclassified Streptomyces TaxID=2593676 RepID=UPI002482035D|nr:hypothetical protein [Streptomyces sp. Isolate_45]MDA5286717.1 hypothetical protein [Streptomyces sp. Isolate_45]